jgi:hypothetical protein
MLGLSSCLMDKGLGREEGGLMGKEEDEDAVGGERGAFSVNAV